MKKKADDILPKTEVTPRIIPMSFRRPDGMKVRGWKVFAQNDGARAAIVLGFLHTKGAR